MAAFNKIDSFVGDVGKGVHNFTSGATAVLTIALTNFANKPVYTNTILGNLTPIAYTNLSARVPTFTSYAVTGSNPSTAKLILADLVLTASGTVAGFAEIVLYNDSTTSPVDALIAWWEYGTSDVVLANTETFTIDFDQTGGVLTLS